MKRDGGPALARAGAIGWISGTNFVSTQNQVMRICTPDDLLPSARQALTSGKYEVQV